MAAMALSSKRWIKDNADCLLSEDMFTWIWHKGEERERSRCDGPPLAGRRGEQLKNENPTKLFPTKVIEWQGRSLQSRSYEEVALPLAKFKNKQQMLCSRCETSLRRAVRTEQLSLLFLETLLSPRVAIIRGKGLARQSWRGEFENWNWATSSFPQF